MSSLPTRRDFLKGVTALGASLPMVFPVLQGADATPRPSAQIENDFLAAAFDLNTGRLRCWRKDGSALLEGCVARAIGPGGTRSTDEPAYRRSLDTAKFRDALGDARRLILRCADGQGQLDFEFCATLYEGRPALLIEAEVRNTAAHSITLESLEPVSAEPETGGALHWPGVTRVLTNGPMYYDPGKVTELPTPPAGALRSWWNLGFFRGIRDGEDRLRRLVPARRPSLPRSDRDPCGRLPERIRAIGQVVF